MAALDRERPALTMPHVHAGGGRSRDRETSNAPAWRTGGASDEREGKIRKRRRKDGAREFLQVPPAASIDIETP